MKIRMSVHKTSIRATIKPSTTNCFCQCGARKGSNIRTQNESLLVKKQVRRNHTDCDFLGNNHPKSSRDF